MASQKISCLQNLHKNKQNKLNMNNQLIEKIIESNGEACPQLSFTNPLIDRNVAIALSKSFVKILTLSNQNSNVNNNLRLAILENVRKLCTLEPENHIAVDENITESLTKVYTEQLASTTPVSIGKQLDAFIMKRFSSHHIDTQHQANINPEIIKALINLNENGVPLELLSKNIVHLDTNKHNVINIVKDLWSHEDMNITDDIASKMKPEIERLLLQTCHKILEDRDEDIKHILVNNKSLGHLVKRAATSSHCFQICCGVLNFLFIMTNFDSGLHRFIRILVDEIKMQCIKISFSVLYPVHINFVVVLLDIEINKLPESIRSSYITSTIKYLQNVRDNSEYDFIMLLSHFPQWFDIYFINSIS